MPVPSNISDLSKVASENSPAGTEPVRGTIDDYLRAHASFIRVLFDLVGGPAVTLPSAPTVNIGFAGSTSITITGTTQISAFDNVAEGATRWITFAGALTLKHSAASMQLPGAADIVTTAGDVAVFKSLGAGNWKCMAYQRISGTGPVAASMLTDGYLSKGDWNSFNSRMTPAAAAAAYLALATGGNVKGDVLFDNGVGILTKDAAGTPTQIFKMQGDNVNFLIHAAAAFNFYNQATNSVVASLSNAGSFTAITVTETSDGRLKKLWRRLGGDLLANVAALKKVGTFVWRKGGDMGMGGCAQEIEKLLPWAVVTDANGIKSVRYGAAAFVIVVELTRAVLAHIARTEKRLAKLEAK